MNKAQQDFYSQMLAKNICEVTFTDPNSPNYERTINCTTNEVYANKCHAGIWSPISPDYELRVVNVDAMLWTLLDLTKITSFKTKMGPSIADLPIEKSLPAKSQYAQVMPDKKEMEILPTMTITHKVSTHLPAKQRWMLDWLKLGSCTVKFIDDYLIFETRASLEQWVVDLAPQHGPIVNDPDIIKAIDLDTGKWFTFKFSQVLSFTTPFETYVPKKAPSIVPKDIKIESPKTKKDYNIQQLQKGICIVTFEKADGTIRKMTCSLDPKIIVALNLQPNNTVTITQPNSDLIRVVDIDKKAWRTINVNKIISFVYGTDIQSISIGTKETTKRRTTLTPV